ncbi:hypothetical protein CLOM_g15131 [Closterium sp. NIES-68]|nr:hypothetical protein CLOM_g15131 [Closterium sp. NIES-68]GJP83272.1 hypothetical protein CLOP_g13445 [Closterium sp. NIES-67]
MVYAVNKLSTHWVVSDHRASSKPTSPSSAALDQTRVSLTRPHACKMPLSSKTPTIAAHSRAASGMSAPKKSVGLLRTCGSADVFASSRLLGDDDGAHALQGKGVLRNYPGSGVRLHGSGDRGRGRGRGTILAAGAPVAASAAASPGASAEAWNSSSGGGEFDCSEVAASTATATSSSDSTNADGAAERDSVTRARRVRSLEDVIERTIFNFRFFTLMAVVGSLIGSALCFTKGCIFVAQSMKEFALFCWNGVGTGKVILLLVEAVDVYLIGTVMLIFGIGLYELFVNSLEVPRDTSSLSPEAHADLSQRICGSSLFGLFRLKARPKWLEIHSLDEMKTKLGHVIVMILLVGMFEKSKKVPVSSALDLLFFSASVCFAAGCLFLLSKLVGGGAGGGGAHGGNGSSSNNGRSHSSRK